MSKNSILLWATVAVICGFFIIWTAAGRPPYGPFNNMGFDSSWDCPPNATSSATVCIKKLPPQEPIGNLEAFLKRRSVPGQS
jgi:hypothetical protein